jgi:hypothetical protein
MLTPRSRIVVEMIQKFSCIRQFIALILFSNLSIQSSAGPRKLHETWDIFVLLQLKFPQTVWTLNIPWTADRLTHDHQWSSPTGEMDSLCIEMFEERQPSVVEDHIAWESFRWHSSGQRLLELGMPSCFTPLFLGKVVSPLMISFCIYAELTKPNISIWFSLNVY